ncbi:VCBS repeat-containing protein [Glycomyces sp. L485]|uniref:FG-GAP repeat domain-containing protein n=1 Tax=Glycomyces sp. L485 TaxID=2909235 RepID=UPI001F4B407F|nr:VCBS repeat-containing protein [Glycomyces sp. L485]MCH7231750.1 VCBS repeat-containing protein [Glycomyces sp. L485]
MKNSSHPGRIARVLRWLVAANVYIVGAAVFVVPPTASAQSEAHDAGPAEQVAAGNYDYNGDGLDDVVARRDATGNLEVWPGDGTGGFGTKYIVGGGWGVMNLIETAGDLNNDGNADIIAREASTGRLWFYPGNGTTFNSRSSIGLGWGVMSAIVSGHDYTGNGNVDIIATEAGTGTLWLYPGAGTGNTFAKRIQIGSSFHLVEELTAVGDMNEDGHADVVGVRLADECMYFYAGPATGQFAPPLLFDCGWDVMESAAAVGDFDGDGHADWLGREPDHNLLYLFKGDGTGRYSSSPVIDFGWNSMTIA